MPMPTDKVSILIAGIPHIDLFGGKAHEDWTDYEIDSDLLTPADGWHVSLGIKGNIPPIVKCGASVEVRVGNDTVLVGRIDEISHQVNKSGHDLAISGRDLAADLLDCSCPIFSAKQATLDQLIAAFTRDFGIRKHRIDAASTRIRKTVAVDAGDTAWDALAHAAEANGLWPWFEPDGTLVVGGPDYSVPEVATLILRRDGKGNNVIRLDKTESMNERYSKLTVFGQMPGTDTEQGQNALRGAAVDTGVTRNRPKIVLDHEADSVAVCVDRAKKLLADSRLNALTISALVKGHRISSDGELWTPGQRVRVISDPHDINDVYFLMARKFKGGRSSGSTTVLTLKEDDTWLPGAHPHNRHRRGKNSVPGKTLDLP